MAPLAALLEAASSRSSELDAEGAGVRGELAALDQEVADKRAEKTIAAQETLKELLKQREALQKKAKVLEGAANHVQLALAKLRKTEAVGLKDWRELRLERLKLSDFAGKKLADEKALAGLQAICKGGSLTLESGMLVFTGNSETLPALRSALEELESSYSLDVELEAEMVKLLETRGEFKRLGDKHGAELSPDANRVHISGSVDCAKKAEKALRWLLSGKAEVACPRELIGACKAQAKDIEAETGAFVEVVRGGLGGGGIMHIRGDADCVREAEERVQSWLDEREGAYSISVDIKEASARLSPEQLNQFTGDLVHFGRKFGINARAQDDRVELRGPTEGSWEVPARAELLQIVDFYAAPPAEPPKEAKPAKAKAKAKPLPEPALEEDNGWGRGDAPEAEFVLGHRW